MEREHLKIMDSWKTPESKGTGHDYAKYATSGAEHALCDDIIHASIKIKSAGMDNFEISGSQMGGAYSRDMGMSGD